MQTERRVAANTQAKPTDLGCESADRLLSSADTVAIYDDHLRLIGKRVVNFLLVFIELFSLYITAEVLQANIGLKSAITLQREPVDPKFQEEVVAPQQLLSFSEN